MAEITESVDIQPLIDLIDSPELLDEGIISAIKGKLTSMMISISTEKMLNSVINKASTKALQQTKDLETKKKLLDLRVELLSLDKKEKKARLKSLIKKAPEKDRTAAELKIRNILKKNKAVNESVLFEDPGISAMRRSVTDVRNAEVTTTVGAIVDDKIAASAVMHKANIAILILGVITSLLFVALVASVVKNIQLA